MKQKSLALGTTVGFAVLFLFILLWSLGQPTAVYAATIAVTKTTDTNDGVCDADCSLREAIEAASTGDTITMTAGTYTLTLGQLTILNKDLILIGADPSNTILSSNILSRVLYIEGSTIILENLTLTNGQEVQGAGIYAFGSTLTLSNTIIMSNTASDRGGGIYLNQEDLTLTLLNNSKVMSNTAVVQGGGIYVHAGILNIENGLVDYNVAGSGGGIYLNRFNALLNLNGGEISYNQSTQSGFVFPGGGVHVNRGQAILNGGQIISNTSYRGGGVAIRNGNVVQNGTLIKENSATYGGGVYVAFPDATFTQTSGNIQENSSTGSNYGGGGLYIWRGTVNLLGGEVISNVANNHGGGMELRFGNLTIDGSTLSNNQAGNRGGAIFNSGGFMTMTNSTVFNNQANLGGGIATNVDDNGASQNNVSRSAILSNTATGDNGGGINNQGFLTLTNVTVSGNNANSGGGIYNSGNVANLTNVTIGFNQATLNGGGLQSDSGTLSVANSIVFSNTAGAGNDCSGTISSLDYNLTGCSLPGSNDISTNPSLQPLALNNGSTLNYALNSNSPAIDAGNPALCPATDQRGNPRPVNGICDIGAYEDGVSFFVRDLSVIETEGTVSVDVLVERSYDISIASVQYSLLPNSALAGIDYTDVSGTLNFASGVTSQTIQIDILGDALDEFDETFSVTLSNPLTATLGDGQAVVTIVDNDAEPTVSINDVSVMELDGTNSVTATFTVTLSAPSAKPITVAYATADVTAVSGLDYTAQAGTLSFASGETTKEINIVVAGDDLDEFDETFELNLNTATNVTIGDGQGVGTITDNDLPPTITIAIDTAVVELDSGFSNTATFTVSLSAPSGNTISSTYSTIANTATAGDDFVALSNIPLIFTPGQVEKTINVTVNGDDIYEGDQTFSVQLANLENLAGAGNSTVAEATIQDNESEPTISIVSSSSTDEGNAGSKQLGFLVTLSSASEDAVTVTYNTNHISTDGSDYNPIVNGTVTFNTLDTSETISVTIYGDTLGEADETFSVDLSNPSGATINGSGQAIGTILDDDPVSAFINDVSVVEPDGTNIVTATFTVTLSAPSAQSITVSFGTNNVTAVSGSDYTAQSGTLSFAPNETSKEVQIIVAGDDSDEFDETFVVNLGTVLGGNVTIGDSQGVGTITDNDLPPTITIYDTAVTELDSGATNLATFTVQLSALSGKTISATYSSTLTGTATAGDDFIAVTDLPITFTPGMTTTEVSITVNGDDIYEGDQTFFVQLAALENLANSGHTLVAEATIQDNESQPTISITPSNSMTEGDTGTKEMTFTVTLSNPAETSVTVTYNSTHITTDNNDYVTIINGTVTFNPLDISETITILINGDEESEPDETFAINLSNPSNNATIAGSGQAIGTILDDDLFLIFLPMVIKP